MSKHRKEGPVKVTEQQATFPELDLYPVAHQRQGTIYYGQLSGLTSDYMIVLITGLLQYKKALEADLKKSQHDIERERNRFEEGMFYHEQLLRINELLYAIKENHADKETKIQVNEWLGYIW